MERCPQHSAQGVAQRKGSGDEEAGLTLTFMGPLRRSGHQSITCASQAGETASWNVGQEGGRRWMKGEGGCQRLHLEGPVMTIHICPEVNENPGRDFNLEER